MKTKAKKPKDTVAERLKQFAKDLKGNTLSGYRVTRICRACGRPVVPATLSRRRKL